MDLDAVVFESGQMAGAQQPLIGDAERQLDEIEGETLENRIDLGTVIDRDADLRHQPGIAQTMKSLDQMLGTRPKHKIGMMNQQAVDTRHAQEVERSHEAF